MTLPGFETPRLTLAPAGLDDVDAIWAVWRDPEVRRYLFDDQPVPRERVVEILVERALPQASDGFGLWVARVRGAAPIVGAVGLLPVDDAIVAYDARLAGGVEPVASFAPAAWDHGFATEALEPLLHHGFTECGLEEIVAVVDVPNERSHRLVRRLGFAAVGESPGPCYRMRIYRLTPTHSRVPSQP